MTNKIHPLLEALLDKGLTKRDIAKNMGWNYDKFDVIFEAPDKYITLHRMQALAILLDTSVEEVLYLCLPRDKTELMKAKLELVNRAIRNDLTK